MSENIIRKQHLREKLLAIADAALDETYERIENLPSRELVPLMNASITLASQLEQEIAAEEVQLREDDVDRTVEVKYERLGLDQGSVLDLITFDDG